MRLGFQQNEDPVIRRVMLSELPINSRKWRKFAEFIMCKPELSEDDKIQMEE